MERALNWVKKYFIPHGENDYKPHLLRYKSIVFLLLLVVIIELGFLAQVLVVLDKTKFLAGVLPGVLANLANKERAENDLPPLVESELLNQAAQLKAEDMAKNGYFAHTSPDGKTPWHWFKQVGYSYLYAGENLAVNFFESSDVSQAWMNSPTHRANIVKKDFTEIGIGVAEGTYEGRHTVFVAELFGKPIAVIPAQNTPSSSSSPKTNPVKTNPNLIPAEPAVPPTENPPNTEVTVAPNTLPTPTQIEVLGEEITISDTLNSENPSFFKSFMQRVLSSPRHYLSYLYGFLGLILVLTIIGSILRRPTLEHSHSLIRGVGLVAVIVVLSIFNIAITNLGGEVPESSDLSANSVSSISN